MYKFGQTLRELRTDSNLTIEQLSKLINYSRSIISYWETGRSEPTESAIKRCAEFFKVSTDYLLGLEEDGITTTPLSNVTTIYSSEERELIEKYRELNAPGKKLVKTVIDAHLAALAENKQKKSEN